MYSRTRYRRSFFCEQRDMEMGLLHQPRAGCCNGAGLHFWFPRFNPQPTIPANEKLAKVDWVGALLNAAAFILLMVVLAYSGSTWKWSSGDVIALWVVLGSYSRRLCCSTNIQHLYHPTDTTFPVQFVKRRTLIL